MKGEQKKFTELVRRAIKEFGKYFGHDLLYIEGKLLCGRIFNLRRRIRFLV
jgi:hypothetical protein